MIPDLQVRFPDRCVYIKQVVRVQGLLEAEVNRRLRDLEAEHAGVDIGYLPQGRENWVTIFASARTEEECRGLVKRVEERVIRLIGPTHISGRNDECLEKVAGTLLRQKGWKMASAESCTGGLFSRKITAMPGASDYFDRRWPVARRAGRRCRWPYP